VFDLALAAFVTQMAGGFDNMVDAPDMGFGMESAVRVDR
jgi:hypothetical protein